MANSTEAMHVVIRGDLRERLGRQSVKEQRSMSEVIRRALKFYFDMHYEASGAAERKG